MRSRLPDGWIRQVPQTRLQQSGAPVVACAACERVQCVFVRGGQAAACMGLWLSIGKVECDCYGAV
jgi:hypothetical protein